MPKYALLYIQISKNKRTDKIFKKQHKTKLFKIKGFMEYNSYMSFICVIWKNTSINWLSIKSFIFEGYLNIYV